MMQGNPTARVRVLSDSVGALAIELRAAANVVKSAKDKVQINGSSSELSRAVNALEALGKELAVSNQNIARMTQATRGPLMALVARDAEQELQRLMGKVDELRAAMAALIRSIKG